MLKLAVVGAGPSAFYVASKLIQALNVDLRVHLYDRLWSPHGLVRYGVAPDHPSVKNCTHKFDLVANDPRVSFFGNVNVDVHGLSNNVQLTISSLLPHYSHILFASGCTVPRPHPTIPHSTSCIPAISIVHWYTHHPSHPRPPPLDNANHISLIGHGNVSLDVARILLSSPQNLKKFDMPQPVLDLLSRSTLKHVSIIGRRGPTEAAFTAKELRELMNLDNASMIPPDDPTLFAEPQNLTLTRQQSRLLQILRTGSRHAPGTTPRTFSIDFFRSPTDFDSSTGTLTFQHTALDPISRRAVSTGKTSRLRTSLVVPSLGFLAERPPLGAYDPERGHLRTAAARVLGEDGAPLRGVYASGWAATGARGVLASTLLDANDVSRTIIEDVTSSPPPNAHDVGLNPEPDMDSLPADVTHAISQGVVLSYQDWKKVDAEELRRGESLGKERERMSWEEVISFLRK